MRDIGKDENFKRYYKEMTKSGRNSDKIEALYKIDRFALEWANRDKLDFLSHRLSQCIQLYEYTRRNDFIVLPGNVFLGDVPFVFEIALTGMLDLVQLGISRQPLNENDISGTNIEKVLSFLYDRPGHRKFRFFFCNFSSYVVKLNLFGGEVSKAVQKGREDLAKFALAGAGNGGILTADIYGVDVVQRYIFACGENGLSPLPAVCDPGFKNDDNIKIVHCEFYRQ
jgi:hypothetical protein